MVSEWFQTNFFLVSNHVFWFETRFLVHLLVSNQVFWFRNFPQKNKLTRNFPDHFGAPRKCSAALLELPKVFRRHVLDSASPKMDSACHWKLQDGVRLTEGGSRACLPTLRGSQKPFRHALGVPKTIPPRPWGCQNHPARTLRPQETSPPAIGSSEMAFT